jgi:hypothetical protein
MLRIAPFWVVPELALLSYTINLQWLGCIITFKFFFTQSALSLKPLAHCRLFGVRSPAYWDHRGQFNSGHGLCVYVILQSYRSCDGLMRNPGILLVSTIRYLGIPRQWDYQGMQHEWEREREGETIKCIQSFSWKIWKEGTTDKIQT